MKLINSNECLVKIARKSVRLFIDEYATVWECSAKRIGYSHCFAYRWRYKKSEFKTYESMKEQFTKDIAERL